MQIMESFDKWKDFLSQNVEAANAAGTSQDKIVEVATRIGNFLAEKVDPANREQRLLRELWTVADDQEKHSLARMLTKLVSDGVRH